MVSYFYFILFDFTVFAFHFFFFILCQRKKEHRTLSARITLDNWMKINKKPKQNSSTNIATNRKLTWESASFKLHCHCKNVKFMNRIESKNFSSAIEFPAQANCMIKTQNLCKCNRISMIHVRYRLNGHSRVVSKSLSLRCISTEWKCMNRIVYVWAHQIWFH